VTAYADKKARLAAELAAAGGAAGIGLAKRTSNLFRDRARGSPPRIDLSGFTDVIRIDADAGVVEAEGMIPYVALADATLAHGLLPAVVPQLKSITLGGAVAGVGIEASSFRHGLVHDTVTALDVLTPDGNIVRCTPDNEHRDLFFGFPNSYGTLGYALAVTARLVPAKSHVQLEHVRYADPAACFADVARHCAAARPDFLDGTVFAPDEMYLTLGRFVDGAPWASDYTYEHMYYRSIRERGVDYLAARDYVWRWDTDWFWCSRNVGAQHQLVRRLLGRSRLNSVTYQRIMRWNSRWGVTRALDRLRGLHSETVIQDVDIPLERAAEFLEFLHREVGILPVWLCPFRTPETARRFPLYPLRPDAVYINFGFWDVVTSREPRPRGFLNRRIEREVAALAGIKSLYSDSYYTEQEFWSAYDPGAYAALKSRYDPQGTRPDLYTKCVRGAAAGG
jgi:FAD/FMN-containing dehydrogenase